MEDQITRLGEGQSRLCTSSKQSARRVAESHETTPKTRYRAPSLLGSTLNSHLTVGEISELSGTLKKKKSTLKQQMSRKSRMNDHFAHTGSVVLVSQTCPQPEKNRSPEQKP